MCYTKKVNGCDWNALKGGGGTVPTLPCLAEFFVRIIGALFLFLGAVSLLFLLYGAGRFVISSGDPKAIAGARNTMTYALLGLVLILISFAILRFVGGFLGLPEDTLLNFRLWVGP